MKQGKWKWIFLFAVFAILAIVQKNAVHAAEEEHGGIRNISAMYSGEAVIVGEKVPTDKLQVIVYYMDGNAELITDYTLSKDTVEKEGENMIQVAYKGKISNIIIVGKEVKRLYVLTNGQKFSVGKRVAKESLSVYAYYSDESLVEIEDYEFLDDTVQYVGAQNIYVTYRNVAARFQVIGMAAKPVQSITASYEGGKLYQGHAIPRRDMHVYAIYPDGSQERVYDYELRPATLKDVGTNRIEIAYEEKLTVLLVECAQRTLLAIDAKYTGDPVEIGKSVDPADVEVIGYFDDGSKDELTGFTLVSSRILLPGMNTVTVRYGDIDARIEVLGMHEVPVSFTNAIEFTATNGTRKANVKIALPKSMPQDTLEGKSLKPAKVSKVIAKLNTTVINYIAFDVLLKDETQDDIFPMTLRIKIPKVYKLAQTSFYYTPNRKSVIAKMAADEIGTDTIEVTIFHPGTYILAYEEAAMSEEEAEEDDYL